MNENKDSTNRSGLASRRALTLAILAVTMCTAAVLLAEQPALAQSSSNNTGTTSSTTPTIKGSVSISNATNAFVKANVKVDFNTAATTAKAQVTNGAIVSGRLSDVQGYLVYTFRVANYDAGTYKVVVVDAGNGQVLYTSSDMTLYNGGIGGGCHHSGYGGFGWGQHANSGSSTSSGTTSGTSGSGLSVLGNNL